MTGGAAVHPIRRAAAGGAPASAGGALAVVTGYWLVGTALAFATQRDPVTRLVALVLATMLAAAGLHLLVRARDDRSAAGALRSFAGGASLWLWCAITFYGGWIVGPAPDAPAPSAPLARALAALHATAYADAASVALLAAALLAVRGHPNRTGPHALLLLWGAHHLARLNVFAGVASPGVELLPPYLRHLAIYFGPPANSPLLLPSVVALAALAVALARRGRRSTTSGGRHAARMLAILAALAALEHLLLGVAGTWAVWAPFVPAHR